MAPASRATSAPAANVATERKEVAKATVEPASGREAPELGPVKGKFVPPTARPLFVLGNGERKSLPPAKWLAVVGLAAVLLFWIVWHVTHVPSANQNAATQGSLAGSSAMVSSGSVQAGAEHTETGPTAKPAPAASSAAGEKSLPIQENAGAGVRKQWRVVAFTYNHADQAQKKVETIAQQHADLRPEVFTPTGRAPYLVTVGGAMNRDQAFALVQQVRRLGLPRDTYAQNYGGKRR